MAEIATVLFGFEAVGGAALLGILGELRTGHNESA